MEESIKKFAKFLHQITITASQLNQFKIKICAIPESHQQIFGVLTRDTHTSITWEDIKRFCQQNGGQIDDNIAQIMGKYLGIYDQKMNFSKFELWLTPTNLSYEFSNNQCNEPITTFIQMLQSITNSLCILSTFQQQFPHHYQNLSQYFYRKYGYKNTLNHQNLRQFMIDRKIYTRIQYHSVLDYLFRKQSTSIPWNRLFSTKNDYQLEENQLNNHQENVDEQQCKRQYKNQNQPLKKGMLRNGGSFQNTQFKKNQKQNLKIEDYKNQPKNVKKILPKTSPQSISPKPSQFHQKLPKQPNHQQTSISHRQNFQNKQHPKNQGYKFHRSRHTVSGLALRKSMVDVQLTMQQIQQQQRKSIHKYVKQLKQYNEIPKGYHSIVCQSQKKQNLWDGNAIDKNNLLSPNKNTNYPLCSKRTASKLSHSTNNSYFMSPTLSKQLPY